MGLVLLWPNTGNYICELTTPEEAVSLESRLPRSPLALLALTNAPSFFPKASRDLEDVMGSLQCQPDTHGKKKYQIKYCPYKIVKWVCLKGIFTAVD